LTKWDEVSGSGSADLTDDGSIVIEFASRLGDEAVLEANCQTSSTACQARSGRAATALPPDFPISARPRMCEEAVSANSS
jgi:hypothetical protein